LRKLFLAIALIAVITLACGCCGLCGLSNHMSTGTYDIKSGGYADQKFSLNQGSTMTYSVSSKGGKANIYIADESSFLNFQKNPPNINYLQQDVADPSTTGEFTADTAGTYYLMVSNHGSDPISVTTALKY